MGSFAEIILFLLLSYLLLTINGDLGQLLSYLIFILPLQIWDAGRS
jgi:hypothetical protein